MTTSSLVSVWACVAHLKRGWGEREEKVKGERREWMPVIRAPFCSFFVAAGICNLLIGWATLSNLLTCVKILWNNQDAGIKRTVVYWHKLWKIKIYADEAVTSHSNLLHFSLPFLFFVPATQAISVHNRHFGPISPSQVSWFCWNIPRHYKQNNPLIGHKPVNIFWLGVTYMLKWDWLLGSHHHLIRHSKHLDHPRTTLERRWK